MNNMRTLVWYFYRPLMVVNLIFTTVCIIDILKIGLWFIATTLIIKAVGYAATVFYKNYFAKGSYMFYRNAGYSITRMYVYAFAIDLTLYLLLIALLTPYIPHHANIKG